MQGKVQNKELDESLNRDIISVIHLLILLTPGETEHWAYNGYISIAENNTAKYK